MPADTDSTSCLRHAPPVERQQSSHPEMNPASTNAPKFNNLLLHQQTQYAVGSSGTATNVNTPRSQMLLIHNFSSMAPEEQGRETMAKKTEHRNFAKPRDSSPDIISTLSPDLEKVTSKLEHSPDLNPEPKPDQECCDERDSSAHQPPPQELQSGVSDAEFVAHPTPMAKSMKKRGRPKKPPESDEPLPMKPATSPVSAADAVPTTTVQRKKRGRPKKQSAEPTLEGAPPPPAATPVSAAVAGRNTGAIAGQETDSAWSDEDDIQAATRQNSVEMPSEQGVAKGDSFVAENAERGQDWAAPGSKETAEDRSASRSIPNRPEDEEDESKEQRQPAARKREEKSGSDKKGSSAQGTAKPLYRVGLSKRFKIAPLLKSVRKP
ncbi:hypothetical protein Trco_006576 [Trichoderma cornu-damae]|uniref:Uncharacterized protein n=1 Tax=Trichoderma cornu-damae TaxID=654480 RepID=A0A9P8TV55_9HYPO|nr:hypothetical protein Trco_006576 [Trichoderma cornu-damae]